MIAIKVRCIRKTLGDDFKEIIRINKPSIRCDGLLVCCQFLFPLFAISVSFLVSQYISFCFSTEYKFEIVVLFVEKL